jgi:hypothetical protein
MVRAIARPGASSTGTPQTLVSGPTDPVAAPAASKLPLALNTATGATFFWNSTAAVWVPTSGSSGTPQKAPIFGAGAPSAAPTSAQLPYYTDTTNNRFYVWDVVDNVWILTNPAASGGQVPIYGTVAPTAAPTAAQLPFYTDTTTNYYYVWDTADNVWILTNPPVAPQKSVIYGTVSPTAAPTINQLPIYINTTANAVWFYDTADGVWINAGGTAGQTPMTGNGPPGAVPTAGQLPYYTDTANDKFYIFDTVDNVWVDTTSYALVDAYLGGQSGGQNVTTAEVSVASWIIPADTWTTSRQISMRGYVSLIAAGGTLRVRLDSTAGPLLGVAGVSAEGHLQWTGHCTVGGTLGTVKGGGQLASNTLGLQTVAATNLTIDRVLHLTVQGNGSSGLRCDFAGITVG